MNEDVVIDNPSLHPKYNIINPPCKDCANTVGDDGNYCMGDEKNHWVDYTGEFKCFKKKKNK